MRSLALNEFTTEQWSAPYEYDPAITIGDASLATFGIQTGYWWVWLGVGVLACYAILFNVIATLAFTFLSCESLQSCVISLSAASNVHLCTNVGSHVINMSTYVVAHHESEMGTRQSSSQATNCRWVVGSSMSRPSTHACTYVASVYTLISPQCHQILSVASIPNLFFLEILLMFLQCHSNGLQ